MPEWLNSWLLDPRTQNLIGIASLAATVTLGAAAVWAPVRQLVEETCCLTGALLTRLLLLCAAVLLCVAALWLLLLPGRYLWLKLLVSAGLLVRALWPQSSAPAGRSLAAVAALSWAVLALRFSPPAPQPWPASPSALPTPPLVVPAMPSPAEAVTPSVGALLIGSDGVALPTVTPGP